LKFNGIIMRSDPELTEPERAIVKKVTRQLLERVHVVLALDWEGAETEGAETEGAETGSILDC
jgi:hypothetical protein